jgi:ferredoxin--NADP+ reductase
MQTLQVAVVGSGPAGLYTAEALIKQAAALDPPRAIKVDVLDRLPTPYGLVRYGVAPDHKSIKSIAEYLRNVLEHDGVDFIGGVHLGDDVTRADLLAAYDGVVYATGAMRDRHLGIPGEDLPGSIAATDFVNWYCGHPDVEPSAFTLDAESVAVIGVGNVAVDVARILIRNPEELRETDVSQPVLDTLMASKVREVHMIGRRGPAQAKFTTKELRELGELEGVDVVVMAEEADLDAFDATGESARLAETDRHVRGNYAVISQWAGRAPAAGGRRLTVRFWLKPVAIEGGNQVEALVTERTRLDESGKLTGTGDLETLPVQMVLRSVGYQSVPLAGVPFDERTSTVPNEAGRVLGPDGQPLPGEYVAGWRHRDEQVRCGRDGPVAAGRPGWRPGAGGRSAAEGRPAADARRRGGRGPGRFPAASAAGGPEPQARQLRGLAPDRGGREGSGRGTRPRRAGQAGQPG